MKKTLYIIGLGFFLLAFHSPAQAQLTRVNVGYSALSAADRTAVVEILRDTKKDLPKYWVAGSGASGGG